MCVFKTGRKLTVMRSLSRVPSPEGPDLAAVLASVSLGKVCVHVQPVRLDVCVCLGPVCFCHP